MLLADKKKLIKCHQQHQAKHIWYKIATSNHLKYSPSSGDI